MRYKDISGQVYARKSDYVNSIIRACARKLLMYRYDFLLSFCLSIKEAIPSIFSLKILAFFLFLLSTVPVVLLGWGSGIGGLDHEALTINNI